MEFEQHGYRAFSVGVNAGQDDELVRFHAENTPLLDDLFGETGQVQRFSRFLTPQSSMVEYFEYTGSLDDLRAAMRRHPNFGAEEAMVKRCWEFPQQFLQRIYHYETSRS